MIFRRKTLCLCALLLSLLAACDDKSAAKQQKKLPLPPSENSLDAALKKAAALPAPAHLSASPAALAFPPQPPDSEAKQSILLKNDGASALTLRALRVAGQAAEFQLGGSCRAGEQLAGGAACSLEISYRPWLAAASQGEVVIDQDGAGPSLFLPLTGAGIRQPPAPAAAPPASQARAALSYARLRQTASLTVGGDGGEAGRRLSEPDYAEAGLPGVVSSFPVDRRRVLTADRYIPAVLENTLNSQLPGRAIAVVERPVFGEEGRLVLIPAGSRVIGQYRAQSKYGLARLDIAWSRILRPDGGSISLEAETADVMGRSGLPGDLDQRFAEKYGSSLLVSAIGAAGDWALAGTSTVVASPLGASTVETGRTQAANRFGNDVDRLAQRMVEDNIDIRPVLTVPQGTRLLIIPTEDIWLRDPDHLQPVTPPKGKGGNRPPQLAALQELLPGLAELLLQTPAVQKAAPQTAQQILQSSLMQQLRDAGRNPP